MFIYTVGTVYKYMYMSPMCCYTKNVWNCFNYNRIIWNYLMSFFVNIQMEFVTMKFKKERTKQEQ